MALGIAPSSEPLEWSVALLGGFNVSSGADRIELPGDAQRLVAFLALQPGRVLRQFVAGTLWEDGTQERAHGNLRSALWRLRRLAGGLVDANGPTLSISPNVGVDVATLVAIADRLCAGEPDCNSLDLDPSALTKELLPGWYDEWTIVHRERLRQRSLHALEALAQALTRSGQYAAAIQAALAAIGLDPLRESPHRCLIGAHIAEGNYSEALTRYHRYRSDLSAQLGIAPSPQLEHMIGDVTASPRRGDAAL